MAVRDCVAILRANRWQRSTYYTYHRTQSHTNIIINKQTFVRSFQTDSSCPNIGHEEGESKKFFNGISTNTSKQARVVHASKYYSPNRLCTHSFILSFCLLCCSQA